MNKINNTRLSKQRKEKKNQRKGKRIDSNNITAHGESNESIKINSLYMIKGWFKLIWLHDIRVAFCSSESYGYAL